MAIWVGLGVMCVDGVQGPGGCSLGPAMTFNYDLQSGASTVQLCMCTVDDSLATVQVQLGKEYMMVVTWHASPFLGLHHIQHIPVSWRIP
jgi:hypothetical protein